MRTRGVEQFKRGKIQKSHLRGGNRKQGTSRREGLPRFGTESGRDLQNAGPCSKHFIVTITLRARPSHSPQFTEKKLRPRGLK